MIQVLIAAACLSFAAGISFHPETGWIEGALFLLLVAVVVNLSSTTDYLNERQFAYMGEAHASAGVIVIRDGVEAEIAFGDIVVGDLMFLMSGENIEVDGILVKGFGVTVKETELTGVDFPVTKSVGTAPFVLAGSVVLDGSGLLLVCAVGPHSNIARKRRAIVKPPAKLSVLQTNMNALVVRLGKTGVGFGAGLFLVLMCYLLVNLDSHSSDEFIQRFVDHFILGLAMLIITVPEALPIVLAVSTARATKLLNQRGCFVRTSHACECLGSIDTLIIDKKRVLMKNKFKLSSAVLGGVTAVFPNYSNIPDPVRQVVAEAVIRNSVATEDEATRSYIGSQIECCLLGMTREWGYSLHDFRCPDKHIAQIPISVQDNKSTTVYVEDDHMKVYSKGNDSIILSRCSYFLAADGTVQPLNMERRRQILEESKKLRTDVFMQTLSLSYKSVSLSECYSEDSFISNVNDKDDDMVYLGSVLLTDQINTRVYVSVLNLLKASTRVILVTNDDKAMAQHVAEATAMLDKAPLYHPHTIMSAEAFRNAVGYCPESTHGTLFGCLPLFENICKRLTVLHSATHEDKLRLAQGLKALDKVVAVTGETINDSYTAKVSDVAIALTISNILVKESSDIILKDDSMADVEECIRLGRHVTQSVAKFVKFQLTLTFVTLIVVSLATLSTWDVPIDAIQVLVVSIVLNAVAAVTLPLEAPLKQYTDTQPLLTLTDREFLAIGVTQTSFQVCALLTVLWMLPFVSDIEPGWDRERFGSENMEHYTIFYASYSFMGLFNLLNVRSVNPNDLNLFKNIRKNKLFVGCWASVYLMIVLIIECGGDVFNSAPSSVYLYAVANLLGVLSLGVEVAARFVASWIRLRRTKQEEKPLLDKSQI